MTTPVAEFQYDLFGTRFSSDRPLLSVPAAANLAGAVSLRMGVLPPGAGDGEPVDDVLPKITRLDAGRICVEFSDESRFVLEASGDIWCRWPDSLSQLDAESYLLGPVSGFHARLRGRIALHASVVEARRGAIAFVGSSGAGKSTMAAALTRLGSRVLSDDLLVLQRVDGRLHAIPGYPGVRLWPDSVARLFGDPGALPPLTPGWDKRYLDLASGERFQKSSLPVTAICLLDGSRAPSAQFQRLRQAEALIELTAHTMGGRVLDPTAREDEFTGLVELVRSVPVWRMSAPTHEGLDARFRESLMGLEVD